VYDEGDDVAHRYGVYNLPTLVVINRQGNIVAVRTGLEGVEDERAIEELVTQAL
jgi:hypothetical protein